MANYIQSSDDLFVSRSLDLAGYDCGTWGMTKSALKMGAKMQWGIL